MYPRHVVMHSKAPPATGKRHMGHSLRMLKNLNNEKCKA
jgi:hypothetical protein